MTAPSDLGTELWCLASHLLTTRDDASSAFRELSYRTCCRYDEEDARRVTDVRSLRGSNWYAEMSRRYTALRDSLARKRQEDFNEVAEVVKSFYPNGCSASDFTDAVQTCTAMLSFTVAADRVSAFTEEKCDEIANGGVHELTSEELCSCLVDGLLLDALVPPRWFADDDGREGTTAKATRIGIRLRPLALAVEYNDGQEGRVRHRRIPLEGVLTPAGPTGRTARRLAQSHGWLLPEAEWQRLLIKLQHLLAKQQQEEEQEEEEAVREATGASDAARQTALTTAEPPASPDTPKRRTSKPQKADVALLYRDPDAALDNVDLNDADELTLQEFKDAMEEKFKANALRPGDSGYEYDRRVAVAPATKKSDWDDDSDEGE